MLVASVVFGLAACGKSAGDEAISKMEGFKDQVCACKDMECAKKVQEDMVKWFSDFAEKHKDDKDMKEDKALEEKADKIQDEMKECLKKLAEGEKKE